MATLQGDAAFAPSSLSTPTSWVKQLVAAQSLRTLGHKTARPRSGPLLPPLPQHHCPQTATCFQLPPDPDLEQRRLLAETHDPLHQLTRCWSLTLPRSCRAACSAPPCTVLQRGAQCSKLLSTKVTFLTRSARFALHSVCLFYVLCNICLLLRRALPTRLLSAASPNSSALRAGASAASRARPAHNKGAMCYANT